MQDSERISLFLHRLTSLASHQVAPGYIFRECANNQGRNLPLKLLARASKHLVIPGNPGRTSILGVFHFRLEAVGKNIVAGELQLA